MWVAHRPGMARRILASETCLPNAFQLRQPIGGLSKLKPLSMAGTTSCIEMYMLAAAAGLVCTARQQWTNSAAQCNVDCGVRLGLAPLCWRHLSM